MEALKLLFGEGEDLNTLQMCLRAAVVFVIGLILVRFTGRRAFGLRMSFDNVITILLGAILSRTVVGASPFLQTVAAAATLAVLHRLFAWLTMRSSAFGKIVKGEVKVLYENGQLNRKNMRYCLITENDLAEALRANGKRESFEDVKLICAERNGFISIIKKENYGNEPKESPH